MALSRLAREFAQEIKLHEWSDSPYRADKAGHRREDDRGWEHKPRLDNAQTDAVRMNVMWVVGQVLGGAGMIDLDDVWDWASACGVEIATSSGRRSNAIRYGFRVTDNDFAGPRADTSLSDQMFIESDWTELDFADDTLVDFAAAAILVTMWLAKRGVAKHVTAAQVRGALNDHYRAQEISEDEVTVQKIELGALREWFNAYWDRNHVPRPAKVGFADEAPF